VSAEGPIAVAATRLGETFAGAVVLDQVDSRVAADTVVTPAGPTGAGKSTIARIGRVIHDLREVL